MKKLSLAKAVAVYNQLKDTKNLSLFEKAILKFINGQIKLKENEIAELKEELAETKADMEDDFGTSLVSRVDIGYIKNRNDRQDSAQRYVLESLSSLDDIDAFESNKKKAIERLENQIAKLKKLLSKLNDLENIVKVEEAPEA